MKIINIPKKTKGQFRTICVPSPEEKIIFQSFLPSLNNKAKTLCDPEITQGFLQNKSPVTNALRHVGFKYTLTFDLSDFFDTVKEIHVKGKLTHEEIAQLMPEGRAWQGLPTSPLVANIAAIPMDSAIKKKLELLKKENIRIVYTRYADDLAFSFDDYEKVYDFLLKNIPQIVSRCGFSLNKKKTWLQDARFGNRIVTGIAVKNDGIAATRQVRRKLRAAIHQKNHNQVRGLREWIKLKLPSKKPKVNFSQSNLNALCEMWDIASFPISLIPHKETEKLTDSVVVSGDPIQILGLSNFTQNWTSCMSHPCGGYHEGAPFWVLLEGTRIAGSMVPSSKPGEFKTIRVGAFTRPVFNARALVHTLENGDKVYDRVYGESQQARINLEITLSDKGYFPIWDYREKMQEDFIAVKGKPSPKYRTAYFDNLGCRGNQVGVYT